MRFEDSVAMPDDVIPFPGQPKRKFERQNVPLPTVERKKVPKAPLVRQNVPTVQTYNMQSSAHEPTVFKNQGFKSEDRENFDRGNQTDRGHNFNYKNYIVDVEDTESLAERVKMLCLLGADDREVAFILEVDVKVLKNWKDEKPEIAQAMWEGRTGADCRVARSLYQRATGYKQQATKIFQARNGDVKVVNYEQYFPPDVQAAIHWLAIRQREAKRWQPEVQALPPGGDGTNNNMPTIIINPVTAVKVDLSIGGDPSQITFDSQ